LTQIIRLGDWLHCSARKNGFQREPVRNSMRACGITDAGKRLLARVIGTSNHHGMSSDSFSAQASRVLPAASVGCAGLAND
jgi:hypothetical protein